MNELGISAYRPVSAPQTVSRPEAETQSPANQPAVQTVDSSAVTGQAHPGQSAGAEQVLATLYEMGVVDSASRPVSPEPEALLADSVTVTVTLADPDQPSPRETTLFDEWRPYQPPAVTAAALPQLLSPDGKSIAMRLFSALTGGMDSLLLNLGTGTVQADKNGQVLTGFADGSFRMLSLKPETLQNLEQQGRVQIETPVPAKPQGESTLPRAATLPEPEKTFFSAENGSKAPPPMMEQKPGGALEWAMAQRTERSFRDLTAAWLDRTENPRSPEALAELNILRQNWAAQQQREDPAAFRLWQSRSGDGALSAAETPEPLPRPETAAVTVRGSTVPAQNSGDAGRENVRWLSNAFSKLLLPEDAQTAALLKNAYMAGDAAWMRWDESATLSRRLAEYLSQLSDGTLRTSTRQQAESMELPAQPERREGELDDSWKRRRIAFEVDAEWTENLKGWLLHVDGWTVSSSQVYVNSQTDAWTTGLMRDRPAFFRQWLGSPTRFAAAEGWFNGATGSFPIETLPKSFTEEDFQRWMRFDVLDFL